jgi:hypothetical protein
MVTVLPTPPLRGSRPLLLTTMAKVAVLQLLADGELVVAIRLGDL